MEFSSKKYIINEHILVYVTIATALMAGNPTVIQAMMKEHEDEVMKVFKTIDELANKHNVSKTIDITIFYK